MRKIQQNARYCHDGQSRLSRRSNSLGRVWSAGLRLHSVGGEKTRGFEDLHQLADYPPLFR